MGVLYHYYVSLALSVGLNRHQVWRVSSFLQQQQVGNPTYKGDWLQQQQPW
ncbi:MAG TPA: hypothetical protein V6D30_00525 [Leptolyngbyaceae cyanobacterium]